MRKHMIRSAPDMLETAGEWALRAEAGLSARDDARLEAWLDADPRHRAAYDAVLKADRALERHGADEALMAMRHAALRARPERRLPSRAVAASLIAGALVTSVAGWWGTAHLPDLMAAFSTQETHTARYATAVGERAIVSLSDGSVLTLNTDSAADVAFDRRIRSVRLVKGQALFSIAHDPSRPFEVLAGGRTVVAVGTAFDVLLQSDALRVAMLEGVVRVSSDRPEPVQTLSKGEVLTARPGGLVTIRKADTAQLAAWRDGVVYFDETPLAEAVVEMSRYARRPIAVADARAGAQRVSGAFRITEADSFAETMAELFSLSIQRSSDGATTLASNSM
jgi:transmembrane sensor